MTFTTHPTPRPPVQRRRTSGESSPLGDAIRRLRPGQHIEVRHGQDPDETRRLDNLVATINHTRYGMDCVRLSIRYDHANRRSLVALERRNP